MNINHSVLNPFPCYYTTYWVFTLFIIISGSDIEITTLPVRPASPSPDHTPALYGYPLDSSDDSSDEDLSETAESLHTQTASTSVAKVPLKILDLAFILSLTDSICLCDGGADSGNDGESGLDLLRDEDCNTYESSGYHTDDGAALHRFMAAM
ncbi:hypothetical protein Tco_1185789 [Tanacetum coccineum]